MNQLSVRRESLPAPSGLVEQGRIAYNQDIGFNAQSVAVDNFTGYWLYIPDAANPYIPPFWVGVVRNLIHTTTRAYVEYRSPFGVQTPTNEGAFSDVTFTNYILPYAPGSLAGTPPSTPAPIPGNPPPGPPPVNVTVDVTAGPVNVTVSPGTPGTSCDNPLYINDCSTPVGNSMKWDEIVWGISGPDGYNGPYNITCAANETLLIWVWTNNELSNTTDQFQIFIDGVAINPAMPTVTGPVNVPLLFNTLIKDLSAGVHTVDLQWTAGFLDQAGGIRIAHVADADVTIQGTFPTPPPAGALAFPGTHDMTQDANLLKEFTTTDVAWLSIDLAAYGGSSDIVVLCTSGPAAGQVFASFGATPNPGVYLAILPQAATYQILGTSNGEYDAGLTGSGTYLVHYSSGTPTSSLSIPGSSDITDGFSHNKISPDLMTFIGGVFIKFTSTVAPSTTLAGILNSTLFEQVWDGVVTTPPLVVDQVYVVVSQDASGNHGAVSATWQVFAYDTVSGAYDGAMTGAGTYEAQHV